MESEYLSLLKAVTALSKIAQLDKEYVQSHLEVVFLQRLIDLKPKT
jgi:hypothetical protein